MSIQVTVEQIGEHGSTLKRASYTKGHDQYDVYFYESKDGLHISKLVNHREIGKAVVPIDGFDPVAIIEPIVKSYERKKYGSEMCELYDDMVGYENTARGMTKHTKKVVIHGFEFTTTVMSQPHYGGRYEHSNWGIKCKCGREFGSSNKSLGHFRNHTRNCPVQKVEEGKYIMGYDVREMFSLLNVEVNPIKSED